MENIQPWCISRQLWWGHQIPAWYGIDNDGDLETPGSKITFVANSEEEVIEKAKRHYGEGHEIFFANDLQNPYYQTSPERVMLKRDPDVLDTWFSSGLWPFSTLGWPDNTEELERFYPTSTLVTAFDIIFFWVARMMMQGLHFMDEVPFKDVYIHALVLDEQGKKMSKSIEAFGADALRFTLASQAGQGRNIRLSVDRIAGYRNFGTKLWSAASFGQMNGCKPTTFDPTWPELAMNKWIVSETAKTVIALYRRV